MLTLRMMPNMDAVSNALPLFFSSLPMLTAAKNNSAVIMALTARPAPTRRPVKMKGSAAGMTTLR